MHGAVISYYGIIEHMKNQAVFKEVVKAAAAIIVLGCPVVLLSYKANSMLMLNILVYVLSLGSAAIMGRLYLKLGATSGRSLRNAGLVHAFMFPTLLVSYSSQIPSLSSDFGSSFYFFSLSVLLLLLVAETREGNS